VRYIDTGAAKGKLEALKSNDYRGFEICRPYKYMDWGTHHVLVVVMDFEKFEKAAVILSVHDWDAFMAGMGNGACRGYNFVLINRAIALEKSGYNAEILRLPDIAWAKEEVVEPPTSKKIKFNMPIVKITRR
jgi:hypothetical protein